jgi:hypothetical protein|tara:strand:+ start:85 stop:702 length:618 start_codon:yes stop_codon:yes gene_type:complete
VSKTTVASTGIDLSDAFAFTGTVTGAGSHEKLHSITASDDATITFNSTYLTSTYDKYFFTFQNILPANDDNTLRARLSFDNGSNYITSGNYQKVSFEGEQGTSGGSTSSRYASAATSMLLTGSSSGSGNASDEAANGHAYFHNDNVHYKAISFMGNFRYTGGQHAGVYSSHALKTNQTDRCNNIQFSFASGNISTGTITLYGVRQ